MRSLKLERADLAVKIPLKYRQEKDGRNKTRLFAMRLTAEGKMSAAEIAKVCGCSRSTLFVWLKAFRSGGFEALSERGRPGPSDGERRGITKKVSSQLDEGISSGRWSSAQAARQWLWSEHKIKKTYKRVWEWIKKAGGVSESSASQTPRSK